MTMKNKDQTRDGYKTPSDIMNHVRSLNRSRMDQYIKNGSRMDQEWIKNGSRMDHKWIKNVSILDKCIKNGSQMDQSIKNGSIMDQCIKNGSRMDQWIKSGSRYRYVVYLSKQYINIQSGGPWNVYTG